MVTAVRKINRVLLPMTDRFWWEQKENISKEVTFMLRVERQWSQSHKKLIQQHSTQSSWASKVLKRMKETVKCLGNRTEDKTQWATGKVVLIQQKEVASHCKVRCLQTMQDKLHQTGMERTMKFRTVWENSGTS